MGKRIRHLEFYGYADQNVYIGLPNADLSDIRETNKEQDKEISQISGATKEKADLSLVKQLSGKVDSFIVAQGAINENLQNGINLNADKITALQQRDEEITSKLNELVDSFDPIYNRLDEIEGDVESLSGKVQEYADFKNEANEKFDALETELGKKLDKTEAEETYAKKSDVYTKREVDRLIEEGTENAATKQWVLSRGYLTEAEADEKYASKASLNALSDRVNSGQTNIYNQYNTLNNDYTLFKSTTNSRLTTINERLNTLEIKHDREITNISGRVDSLQEQINVNKNDIRTIKEIDLPNKVDKSDFNDLKSDVNSLRNDLNNKVDKVDYNIDKTNIINSITNLDEKKADKTALSGVSGAVDSVNDGLEQEILDRIAGDNALGQRIDGTNARIDGIESDNIGRDTNISNLRVDLEKEIQDRIDGDNSIIGQPSDRDVALTIYGTRKYADKVASDAVDEANVYTDNKDSELRIFINDEVVEPLRLEISAKADKTYVNEVKNDILNEIDSKIAVETARATDKENALEANIASETSRALAQERQLISATTHIGNIVAALTDWDGDDREDYTDVGNGIIDVMHRELHELNETIIVQLLARISDLEDRVTALEQGNQG